MNPLTTSDPRRVGPYVLVARLGSGGMGRVYLGITPAADKVAVKVIKPELMSAEQIRHRFAAEVDHLKMVYGARVARFDGAGIDGEQPWLAAEYVPGMTLLQYVELRGPLEPRFAAMLGAALAEGLWKIHQAGVLHRDLKPQNILLGPDGPKVIDFGLAVLIERDEQLTESGTVIGTAAYMPPEQARGEQELTPAADVYALGATLVFASTGSVVYSGTRGLALLGRITDPDDHPDLGPVPDELRTLVGAMLAHEPSARPPLQTLTDRLLEVATAGGHTAEELRRQLAERTFAEPHQISLPADVEDPREEDIDLGGGEHGGDTPDGDESASLTPEPVSPHGPTPGVVAPVGWLVERLRVEYGRQARF